MSARFDVVAVGDLNADLVLSGDVTPVFGQVEKLIDDATLTLGGSTAIFACGAARLGLRVAMVSLVGTDPFGDFLLDTLAARGVNTQGVRRTHQHKTGLTTILSHGVDRAMLTYPGTLSTLCRHDIDSTLVTQARHLHLGCFYLLDALRPDLPDFFAWSRSQGLTVSLDTNYDPTKLWDGGIGATLDQVDLFLPNETELTAITHHASWQTGLASLSERVPTVAVKRGSAGASATRNGQTTHATPLPVQVVDTTGAGDSFDAGFVYAHLAGWPLPQMLQFAVACGSASTRAAGGTHAQPTQAHAQTQLTQQGFPPPTRSSPFPPVRDTGGTQ